ncbi:MAG TPA: MFS transporter [Gammaproteobacteria bacterium]|nr:MFS transporter [Gammaproteobacteria bacterium]
MAQPYSKDPDVERSLQHSVRDGAFYSLMSGGGETYLSAYALFLKATTTQIALLAALPPLLGSFAQLFSAWFGKRIGRRKGIIMAGVILQALMWWPMIWLPYFFPAHAVPILLGCVILFYAAGHLSNPVWNSLMGDLVPAGKRGRYFASRTATMNLASFIALITGGAILNHFQAADDTRIGFAIVFSLAASARLMSAYHISHMIEPPNPASSANPISYKGFFQRLKQSSFVRFSVFFSLMNFAVCISAPFFAVFMLRDLQFSYLEFTGASAASVLMQFVALRFWGRISDTFGNRLILTVTGCTISIIPALWVISTHYWYIVAIHMLSGLTWAGFSLSASNFVYDAVAPGRRAMYVAINSVLSNTGVFFGALLGGLLGLYFSKQATFFGHTITWSSNLYWVFLISAAARIIMVAIFIPHLREVREVQPLPSRNLILRAPQLSTFTDLLYSLFSLGQRKPPDTKKQGLKAP